MNLERLSPWNWFKTEDDPRENRIPVQYNSLDRAYPLSRVHEDIDRMFEEFFRGFGVPSLMDATRGGERTALLRPSLDIEEREREYLISVEVPGVAQDNVDIQLQGRTLVISGEKSQEQREDSGTLHRVERSYGAFRRVLTLPDNANADHIDATFDRGVLRISVAKEAGAGSDVRKIAINRG